MILDLIEVTPRKLNIKKVIIAILILLIIIGLIIYFIVNKELIMIKASKEKEYKVSVKQIANVHTVKFKEKLKEPRNIINEINSIYESEEKRVFLTFDDGPSKTVTPLILDLLKQENIKATFFLLGSRVELSPELVKREYEEGHYIGNHGYSHIYGKIYESPQSVIDEYNMAEQAIKNALEKPEFKSYLFRYPGGYAGGRYFRIKEEANGLLVENEIAHLDWNALTADAAGQTTIEGMLEYVKETIGDKNSVVILMHDASDKILTYEMLPHLIAYLREKGYAFKNIYDLI